MKRKDARQLAPEAQEAIRMRAVEAVQGGMSQTDAARVFGVTRRAVNGWVRRYRAGGPSALKAHKRGRPPSFRLPPHEAALTVRTIKDRCPERDGLPTKDCARHEAFHRHPRVQ